MNKSDVQELTNMEMQEISKRLNYSWIVRQYSGDQFINKLMIQKQ